jgi:small subunit ribosomal protein S1
MFEALEREGGRAGRGPRIGDEVSGTVVKIASDAVYVDLGGKAEGLIERSELLDPEGNVRVAIGDRIRSFVLSYRNGVTTLGTRFGARGAGGKGQAGAKGGGDEVSPEIGRAFESGLPLLGRVKAVNKGGVEVEVAGAHAFCPISQLDLQRVEDASAYVGRELEFVVTKFETGAGRPNIVLSRRTALEAERAARAAEVVSKLEVGAVVKGKVTRLQIFGAFVDIGGVEGLLHKSELGIGRNARIEQVLQVGQEIEASVTKLEASEDPRKPSRISLSMKQVAAVRETEDAKSYKRPSSGTLGTLGDLFGKLKR